MNMVPFRIEDCDAYCKVCKKHFVVALHGEECPVCGNKNPETISVRLSGSLGHEKPASLKEFRKRERYL
jgi:hypothetical protein